MGKPKGMAYSILRFGKLKSPAQVKASRDHCMRSQETRNADPTETPCNRQLIGCAETLWEHVEVMLNAATTQRKTRPDANLVCEVLLSASPAWFRHDNHPTGAINAEKVEVFSSRATEFLQQSFGAYCLSAVLHLDETTPHIHAHVVPIHPEKGWLSWENWFGGREKLQEWQDKIAEAMEPLGLQRGIKGTIAQHEHIQDFYGRIKREVEVPDLEREFVLPLPLAQESVQDYHQRASEFLAQRASQVQDAISTVVAHAKNEEFALRKERESRLTSHRLADKVEQLERQYLSAQTDLKTLSDQQKQAIAQELITTANMVLNLAQSNYWKGQTYILSRRRGFTKIDTRDGKRLVHDQGGVPTLTSNFQLRDLEKVRRDRDRILLLIAQTYEGQDSQRKRRR
ncbi:plasmid recombination protein (plasmid) [Kovacikia minuta CCNUW1]|uniref:MobV family relaxase n=1 Tax=Kovacikia minuta TaxID=2931930 RepID=UPI001CCA3888|nr:MobV family relaxase [Kovacikia minuta]UBF30756.1 plasmid recombination protein [Kovacikia minuta CCNUW1]